MSWSMMLPILSEATLETLFMVITSTFFAILLGLPLGTFLFVQYKIKPNKLIYQILNSLINITRSIPFIILLVALIPFTRYLVGSSIGLMAAVVPLTIGATPFFARLTDNIYRTLPSSLLETSQSMGANTWQMIRYFFMPEAMQGFIQAATVTAITLINYSAMAGTVGAGGLGDVAIRYGYQRFDFFIMIATVAILVILVQCFQILGDRLAGYYKH